jgi:hypothetical protein
LALPIYLILELIRYAKVQHSWSEKIGVVITMLPIFIFVTVCGAVLWAFALTGFRMLVNPS